MAPSNKLHCILQAMTFFFILIIPLLVLKYTVFVLVLADITEAAGIDP